MPTYEYRCARCDELIEVYQSFSDAPLTKHSGCGGKLTKVLSPAGIVLMGSGYYKTDNRGKSSSGGSSSRSDSSTSSGSGDSATTGGSTPTPAEPKKSDGKKSSGKAKSGGSSSTAP
ncbi:MAG: FmdB family zinc ribbon protein [Actinomycetota bacterium]